MALDDPIQTLARQRIISASAELEAQIASKAGGAPAVLILRRLRDAAAESLAALVLCQVHTAKGREEFNTLANEVKRYDEWVIWMRGIIQEGRATDAEMENEEREELFHMLVGSGRSEAFKEAVALGLIDDKRVDAGSQFD